MNIEFDSPLAILHSTPRLNHATSIDDFMENITEQAVTLSKQPAFSNKNSKIICTKLEKNIK